MMDSNALDAAILRAGAPDLHWQWHQCPTKVRSCQNITFLILTRLNMIHGHQAGYGNDDEDWVGLTTGEFLCR